MTARELLLFMVLEYRNLRALCPNNFFFFVNTSATCLFYTIEVSRLLAIAIIFFGPILSEYLFYRTSLGHGHSGLTVRDLELKHGIYSIQ